MRLKNCGLSIYTTPTYDPKPLVGYYCTILYFSLNINHISLIIAMWLVYFLRVTDLLYSLTDYMQWQWQWFNCQNSHPARSYCKIINFTPDQVILLNTCITLLILLLFRITQQLYYCVCIHLLVMHVLICSYSFRTMYCIWHCVFN